MDFRPSLNFDVIGVAGIILATVLLVLDKAGKLKGGLLIGLLCLAGAMTLFLAIGNSWVWEAPAKWRLWRGLLMLSLVVFTYSGLAIWISADSSEFAGHEEVEEKALVVNPEITINPKTVTFDAAIVHDSYTFTITNNFNNNAYSTTFLLRIENSSLSWKDFTVYVPPTSRRQIDEEHPQFSDMGGLMGYDQKGHSFFYLFIHKMAPHEQRQIRLTREKLEKASVRAEITHSSDLQTPLIVDANEVKFPFITTEQFQVDGMLRVPPK